jgi:hypothetical protein
MTKTIEWHHPAGHRYLHAVLVLTRIVIRPEGGVFEVDFGVWENASAYEMTAAPLHQDELTFAIDDFSSLNQTLEQVSALIQHKVPNITNSKEDSQ